MYNRGDCILFSMKGRIADSIRDDINGDCYIVECEGPGNPVIRIPAGNIDMRYPKHVPMPQARNPFGSAHRAEVVRSIQSFRQRALGAPYRPIPERQRRPSTPDMFVDGVPQFRNEAKYFGVLEEEQMHMPMTRMERDRLRRARCPMPPEEQEG